MGQILFLNFLRYLSNCFPSNRTNPKSMSNIPGSKGRNNPKIPRMIRKIPAIFLRVVFIIVLVKWLVLIIVLFDMETIKNTFNHS